MLKRVRCYELLGNYFRTKKNNFYAILVCKAELQKKNFVQKGDQGGKYPKWLLYEKFTFKYEGTIHLKKSWSVWNVCVC